MGMIIRTVFNNNNWDGACKDADRDRRLYKCKDKIFNTKYKVNKRGNCLAKCWESTLCKNFYWINPLGNFDVDRAKGDAFFVYQDLDNSLVLWGKSKISNVNKNKVKFYEFTPLAQEKWVRGLLPENILGAKFGRGTFRYTDDKVNLSLIKIMKTRNENYDDAAEVDYKDKEGKKILLKHLVKERSISLVIAFKNSLKSYNCQICNFNFRDVYGDLGEGFIEAHHKKPIASLKENEKVSIKDLMAVCSNCHRMFHKKTPLLRPKRLEQILKRKNKKL